MVNLSRVEFIGLPGSGKSTIRKELVSSLKKTSREKYLTSEEAFLIVSKKYTDKVYRVVLNSLPEQLALKVADKIMNRSLRQLDCQNRFLARYGSALAVFLSSNVFHQLSVNERKNVIGAFVETGSIIEFINEDLLNNRVVFFEEGLIQKSFMFVSHNTNAKENSPNLFSYLEKIPLPDFVVYVNPDINTCVERMKSRPDGLTGRLRKVDEKDIMKFFENADLHLKNTTKWLEQNGCTRLLEVNSDTSLDSIVEKLNLAIKGSFS